MKKNKGGNILQVFFHGVNLNALPLTRDLQQSIAREPSAPSIPPPAYQSSPAGGHATAPPTPAPRTMPVSRPGLLHSYPAAGQLKAAVEGTGGPHLWLGVQPCDGF